jgi:chorismate mutase
MSLDSCRNNIDAIDVEILSLLARRIAVVREIAAIKLRHSLPIIDQMREAEILGRLTPLKNKPEEDAILRVYEEIIIQSRQIQSNEMSKHSRRKRDRPSSHRVAQKDRELNNDHR